MVGTCDNCGCVINECECFNEDKQPNNELTNVQQEISNLCDEIKEMLLDKNRKYGNSALEPTRVFSKASNVEQIKVRLDDKISRLKNQQIDEDEDVINDLIGYLILLKIALRSN